MSEIPAARPPSRRRLIALAGVAALLYGIAGCSNPAADLGGLAKGQMAKLKPTKDGAGAPAAAFVDASGKPVTLAAFKGKVTVVNLWAKWCAPCLAEIPSLAALQREYVGKPLQVVAISLGKGEDEVAGRAFLAKHPPLKFYSDQGYAVPFALKPPAADLPTTILYDRNGVERARLTGGADWSGKDAKAVMDRLLAQ